MITRIYIDNYKCLTNFEITPTQFQLWMGANGSGKTSTFNALRNVQSILWGVHIDDVFSVLDFTTWNIRQELRISITLDLGNALYDYILVVAYSPQTHKMFIKHEALKCSGETIFLFDGLNAHLYRFQESGKVEEISQYPADSGRSAISALPFGNYPDPLSLFRIEIGSWLFLLPIPLVVTQMANAEERFLSLHAENFAQWYRHILQEHPDIGYKAKELLIDILPGFEQLSLKDSGEARRLTATFRINERDWDFDFMSLSEGQRQLIVLYTVLEALRKGIFSTLFIDEPDNFVSLREIQPWLANLEDICEESNKQAILISHHPEIINTMARGEELWFSRQEGAHVLVKPFPESPGLTPSETMVRGWENE